MAFHAILSGLLLASSVQAAAWSSCCECLGRELPHEVFSPSHGKATYNRLNNARWSDTTILSPDCIFQPKDTEDVSRGLKVLVEKRCQFAIKSGGHNPKPGANNINGGVSIDLGLLNQTTLAPDRSYVSLGTGSTWGAAYDEFTGKDGVLFPGGLCGSTGVGGISIGGGQSYLIPKVGWVVDNVLNYEVVLASGRIVNANQKSHPDLFKALKGGGSNFGIVTRTDVAAFEQGDIWAGQVITPGVPATVEAALQATANFTEQANSHPDVGTQVVFTYSNGSTVIISSISSNDGTENPAPLQGFTALQPQVGNTVSLRAMSDVVKELDQNQASGYRDATATISFVNDYATLAAVQNVTAAVYAHVKDEVPNMDFILFLVPMPKISETYAAARGGNALGLSNRDKDLIVAFVTPRWKDEKHDQLMYNAVEQWTKHTQEAIDSLGTTDPFLYHNFASPSQKPFCGYGEHSVHFLKRVSHKYDPAGVFQKLVPGGFKISDANC